MKCLAGVEYPSGKACPKCNAKLGDVCWPGINAELLELARLRKGIQDFLDGNYVNPRKFRPGKCAHGRYFYEECGECTDFHFADLLTPSAHSSTNSGGARD